MVTGESRLVDYAHFSKLSNVRFWSKAFQESFLYLYILIEKVKVVSTFPQCNAARRFSRFDI